VAGDGDSKAERSLYGFWPRQFGE